MFEFHIESHKQGEVVMGVSVLLKGCPPVLNSQQATEISQNSLGSQLQIFRNIKPYRFINAKIFLKAY